jgi:hypothetical protein
LQNRKNQRRTRPMHENCRDVRDERPGRAVSDDYALLVGLARAYVEARLRFGMPGQPTFMAFPSIRGTRPRLVVDGLAAIGGDLTISDPDGIVERARRAINVENTE